MSFRKKLGSLLVAMRIYKYKLLSDCSQVAGQPRFITPTLLSGKGKIIFEKNVKLGVRTSPGHYDSYIYIDSRRPESIIHIGQNCWFNNHLRIISDGAGIKIGDNCLIGYNVEIIDSNFHDLHPLSRHNGKNVLKAPVLIQDNVFVGNNVVILKGVTIGKNSIIGSGSVVTNDIPENAVAAGNPAKFIKSLTSI